MCSMATKITIRDVPEGLHRRIKLRATRHRRSMNSEIVAILEEAVGPDEEKRRQVMERIKTRREEGPRVNVSPEQIKSWAREDLA